ncbi:uncharacterized protein LOC119613438 [Lucilia sericata]|uniref:uncharacterized protein LOC119613438 n=1 Tax=Lucilia sericata TaxID=13632 RepID=UPI0018A7F519|nr:uncharacterized protein LOC119613438 [Lucilia sericata]
MYASITLLISGSLVFIFLTSPSFSLKSQSFTFSKVECFEQDKEFLEIKECYLKTTEHNNKAISLYMDIKNKTFNEIKIHGQLLQKFRNNYRPFLYNDVFDWCDFMNNQRPHILWNFIYETTKKYSNLNHTCPLNHDVIIKDFIVDDKIFKIIPFARGEYLVVLKIIAKLFRKANSKYRPFLYDDVIDYCEFHNNAKRHIFWNLLYTNLGKFSNMNHSCPYDHDFDC